MVDASAALSALLSAGAARSILRVDSVHAPHLIDAEVASGLRGLVAGRRLDPTAAWAALDAWRRLGMQRYPMPALLHRMWQLRDNLTAYDAAYVALAESLGCVLLTADRRLGRAPGLRCSVTVLPG